MVDVGRTFLGNKVRMEMDDREWDVLVNALANYTDGHGMRVDDPDEPVLDALYEELTENA